MKKLNGMKRDFSALENKKMKNLQNIQGGTGSAVNYVPTNRGDCYDKETWVDHQHVSTLEVC